MPAEYIIKLLSERSVLLEFEGGMSQAVNQKVIALHEALRQKPFAGYVESVPGYNTLGVFFDAEQISTSLENCLKLVGENIRSVYTSVLSMPKDEKPLIEIPVHYGGANGPDIELVAQQNNITVEEVIHIHAGKIYTIFMTGFLPGFPYMGITDERITIERRATPRLQVPAGSVGLAGNQTGIYPVNAPGGWQLIGKTDLLLFDASKENACLLQAGDRVKFVAV